MSSNFHIVMNTGTCVLMYAVLHGIAQIPVGKAQNLAQNELKFSYSDEHRNLWLMYSSNSSGERSKSSPK